MHKEVSFFLVEFFQLTFADDYARPFTGSPTLSTMTSNSSPSLASSIPESERDLVKMNLSSPLYRVAKAMAQSDSGLEVKDRTWLKMTIPKSFIGNCLSLLCKLNDI